MRKPRLGTAVVTLNRAVLLVALHRYLAQARSLEV